MLLYKITNIINNKCYIGFTSRTVEDRFNDHIKNAKYNHKLGQALYSAMRKYSPENFIIEQIYEGDDALEMENEFIQKYNAEYNMAPGGSKPPSQKGNRWNHSEETKARMRKPKPPFTEEHKANISKALKGKKQDPEFVKYRTSCVKNRSRPFGKTYRAKSYIVTHPDGREESVYNIAQFAREHNLSRPSICNVCKGKRAHTKGYKFRYE